MLRGVATTLIEELREICGDDHVVTQADQLRTYESDGLLQYRALPRVVVLPDTADQVQRVVRLCHEHEVPWVARGAGSGLSGGAVPVEEGVLIVLSRMRRVVEVDILNQRVTVEPGVTNIDVSKAVAPTHFYPPDPSSQIACSIGGNVAENSGGAHCFKYGFTTNYVTGLKVVLPDGSIEQLGGKGVDSPGYDLLGAFVGSEGTLGIAVEITLRVVPQPATWRTLVAFFDSMAEAGQTVSDIVGAGIVPAAMEIMDRLSIEAAEGATHAGYPTEAGAALIVELDGSEAECEVGFERVEETCDGNGAWEIRIAEDDLDRQLIWKTRKAAFAAMGRISPNYYVQDSVIPRTRLPEVLQQIDELADEHGLRVANVFHAGDGNLHPLVCYDGANPGEPERAEELAGLIVAVCVDAGGAACRGGRRGGDKKRFNSRLFGRAAPSAAQKAPLPLCSQGVPPP